MADIKKLIERIRKFRDERGWAKYHDPKNLAVSVVLEAAELLEHFQWKSPHELNDYVEKHKEEVSEEVADVLIYLLNLADMIDVDILEAAEKKITKNEQKYPVKKVKGNWRKYNKL